MLIQLIASGIALFGQTTYIRLGLEGRYGINGNSYSVASAHYDVNIYTDEMSYNEVYNAKTASFGSAILPEVSFGVKINRYFSAEFGYSHLFGLPTVFKSEDTWNISESWNTIRWDNSYCFSSNGLHLRGKFSVNNEYSNPYLGLGFVFGKGKMKNRIEGVGSGGYFEKYTESIEFEEIGKPCFGFQTAVGYDLKLSKRFTLNFELSYYNMSFWPTEGTRVEWWVRKYDILGMASLSEREYIYTDEVAIEYPADNLKPTYLLPKSYCMNNLSFRFGVLLWLGYF